MPIIDETPKLTVYRDGLVNLNGEASRALAKAVAVTLSAPASPGGRWLLVPVPSDHPGALPIYTPSRGRGQRFRAYALATAAFALLPDSQKKLNLELLTSSANMFRLTVI